MRNPFAVLSRANIEASMGRLIERFPIPTLIVIIFSIFLFYFIESETKSGAVTRAIFTFGITFFFSTGVALYVENRKDKKYISLLSLVPLIYGIAIYTTIDVGADWLFESVVYLLLHLFGFVTFLFFAPYVDRFLSHEDEEIEYINFFTSVSWSLLMSMIVGLALLGLGFIAIGSILALFDLKDIFLKEDKLYANWAVIALALIAPLYGLISLPIKDETNQLSYNTNTFFSFLIRYVGVPFIYIYFIILYAYTAKVLINFSDWPKGLISWMVIGFSVFGYLNYIFSKPYEAQSSMISLFRKYFPMVVLPQMAMLFYAIYLRTAQYDLTMNRYFVIIFGIWLTFISLYLILSRKKALSVITASLALLSFIISVGPWSVFSYPLSRQYTKLVLNLEKANILKEGTITPLSSPKDISKELSNDIYSGIQYICDFSECQDIKALFKNELVEATLKSETDWKKWNTMTGSVYPGINKWEIISAVTEKIKVQMAYSYDNSLNQKYIQYNTNYQYDAPYPLTIEDGYTKVVRISGGEGMTTRYDTFIEKDANYPIYPYITMNPDDSTVAYHRGSGDILTIPFTPPVDLLNKTTPTGLEQKDLTLTVSSDRIEAKLYLQNFAVKNPSYTGTGGEVYYTISGIGLVKEK